MKTMKRLFALALALMLVMSLAVTASAAETTGTITITPPTGLDSAATNTYKIYKVFDAVADGKNISYKLVEGKTTVPNASFSVDTAGNVSGPASLSEADIAAIAAYVTENDLVDTVTTIGSNPGTSKALDNGYYYITTSTGTVVTIDSTTPTANVIDKNQVPVLEKIITAASSVDTDGKKALAEAGTDVTYQVTIQVKKGAKGYVLHDEMESALHFNGGVQVSVGGATVDPKNYTVTSSTNSMTVTFTDSWIKDQVGKSVVVTYSAKVTSAALQTDPAVNKAWLTYGDANTKNKTPDKTTAVYNAKFTVTKQDGNHNPLAGAGFVIKNAAGEYYKLENNVVSWVDSIANATEYISDAKGEVQSFTGLANGTYTLVEKTVPAGYNKAADSDFTVAEHDYSAANLIQTSTVVNNAGTELPSTGGIGTTLFYVFGGILMAAAAVLLVTKRRMSTAE